MTQSAVQTTGRGGTAGVTGERLMLPRAPGRTDEASADSPFAIFARLATRCTGSGLAALVIEDPSGLQVYAASGLADGQPLPVSLLRAQMSRPRRMTVEIADLSLDPTFAKAPPHEREAGFAAYAGATIRNPAGAAIGILCLLDRERRRYGRDVLMTLTDLARGVAALLAAQRGGQQPDPAGIDAVTALPGRQGLVRYLDQAVGSAPDNRQTPALALFRIDFGRLSTLNEMYGREIADRFLEQAADRLQTIAPMPGFLAHLGGSGFALAAPGRIGPSDAEAMVLRMMERLREPVQIDALELPLRPSVGIGLYPADGETVPALLVAAEAALSFARTQGDGRHCARQQRWNAVEQHRPGHGEVGPDLFIPVAEAGGLIEQIDAWVLRAACREAQSWEKALGVSVNVSSVWLSHSRLSNLLRRVLDETGLEPNRLQIELSERGALDKEGNVRRELAQVRAMGVRLALDDFGTGYSCLSALTTYPFDQVKLDRQFVHALGRDRRAEAVMRSMLQMVQALGMTCCAEGVETEEQLAFLDAHGCEEIQGYLLGRPIPHLPLHADRSLLPAEAAELEHP